jgi:tetratricopeptide (TPR) repeat protein
MSAKKLSIFMIFIALFFGVLLAETEQSNGKETKQINGKESSQKDDEILSQTMPRLRVNGERDLKLEKLDIDIKIVGQIATTTLDMTFYNDENKVIEGELNFPLADGQTISRYALQIGKVLREGVVVEKEKGRKVFESIVRRRVDPGLIEKTKGNNFKTRIYPIPARGSRRVVIAYEHELKAVNKGLRYTLPLSYQQAIDEFKLDAVVYNCSEEPKLGNNVLNGIDFEEESSGYAARLEMNDFLAQKDLSFTVPYPKQGNNVFIEEVDGETYFFAYLKIDAEQGQKPLPRKLAVYWDISSSGTMRQIENDKKLLRKYIEKIGYCSVSLIQFNIWKSEVETFEIRNGNSREMMNSIDHFIYDGATQLGEIDFGAGDYDEILLFSDGLSNFGKKQALTGDVPVIAINSSLSANHSYLKYLAAATGGRYINMIGRSFNEAFEELTNEGLAFQNAEYRTSEIEELFPNIKTYTGQGIAIAGKLKSLETRIKLNFGYGKYTSFSEVIEINKDDMIESGGVVARLWANKKLARLEMQADENIDEITRLGTKYSIVTDNTSLIVLETARDYARFDIEPPEDLREAVEKIKSQYVAKTTPKVNMRNLKNKFNNIYKHWKIDFEELQRIRAAEIKEKGRIRDSIILARRAVSDSLRRYIDSDTTLYLPEGSSNASGSIYGTLKGTVVDENGEAMVGATIRIEGTTKGAFSKADGRFTITGIEAGDYSAKITYVGKATSTYRVRIGCDWTTHLDAMLIQVDYKSSEILCVTAERIMVDNAEMGSSQTQTREEMEATVGSSIAATVAQSAGVLNSGEGFSIRRERSSETQIRVDGLDVMNRSSSSSDMLTTSSMTELGEYDDPVMQYGNKEIWKNDEFAINKNLSKREYEFEKYAERMSKKKDKYKYYLRAKEYFNNNPEFYFDSYDLLMESDMKKKALLVISNLLEMRLEDHELARTIAYRLMELKEYELAEIAFEDILKIRGEEPQSYRDLALVKIEVGKYQEAADLLYSVIMRIWDGRFRNIDLVVMKEFNNLVTLHSESIDLSKYDENLIKSMPVDIRVVLTWDKDNCDVDLWVTDPSNEACYYSHRKTRQGGLMSYDLTGGYGPEDFILKDPIKGEYKIEAKFYNSRIQRKSAPIFVQATVFRNYGRANQTNEVYTLKLKNPKDKEEICTIVIY